MSLTVAERETVQEAIDLLSGLLPASGRAPDTSNEPSPSNSRSRSPKWEEEMERCWTFLNAVDQAGGSLLPKEISVIARDNGYDPRAINGFYRGEGCLRRDGDRRELTDVGRDFIEQWRDRYGPKAPS